VDGSPHVIRSDEPPYGTSMPGAGAVHHIKSVVAGFCRSLADFRNAPKADTQHRLAGRRSGLPPALSINPGIDVMGTGAVILPLI